METSKKQISLFGEDKSTSSQEAFPVSHFLRQVNDKARRTIVTSGTRCLEQFKRFPRVGSWERMFADLLIGTGEWFSTRCVLTWKVKGTKCSRFLFQLLPSTPPTDETESGLLPTLTGSAPLKDSAMNGLLPTPTATSDLKGGCTRKDSKRQKDTLAHAIHGELGEPGRTSQLNPLFVEEMMGFPENWTLLPFLSGETKASKPTETP